MSNFDTILSHRKTPKSAHW